jgi:molecular chaperone HscA
LREAQVEAQRLVEAVQSALMEDAHLLSMLERAHIDNCLAKLQSVLVGDDRRAIDLAMDALSKGTAEFAARRMNQSVQRALSGKKVEEL